MVSLKKIDEWLGKDFDNATKENIINLLNGIERQPLGFKRGQISYTDYRFFAAEKKLIELALSAKLEGHKIIKGRILTGDQFMTHKDKQDKN